ncbi:MAG: TetR/AcrR family transcriptional regulator [Lachnospiraceae bacterium]|nr:TetR/AcrR family transcriptional regulator [Lachnospiraceae bacterium]
MENRTKRDQILDAFRDLLENKDIHHISVSDIAKKAGIGKGSLYYYFSSKDEMLNALIKRTYAGALEMAKELVHQTDLTIYSRLAKITNACVAATGEFLKRSEVVKIKTNLSDRIYDSAYIHQQFMKHSIVDFKDIYTEIIQQEIDKGTIKFDSAAEIAEIVLIVLTVKIDNTLSPSSDEETAKTLQTLITLLERGTGNADGAFGITI